MADDPDPPRKFYQFKPTAFEMVNDNVPATPPAPETSGAPDPGPQAADRGRIDVRDLFRTAATPGSALAANPSRPADNDVHAMLRLNAAAAEAAGLNLLRPKPRQRSHRKRDYWISIIGGNGSIIGALFLLGPNLVSLLFAFGGVIILTTGLTWIFWFVLDDY